MKKRTEKIYHYNAIFDQNGDGYTVTVPDIRGLVTEAKTLSEARIMAKDAIRCALEAALKEKPLPIHVKHRIHRERVTVEM